MGFDYNRMDVDSDGNVYFGAQAQDTIYFQFNDEEYQYAPVGTADIFIAKYTNQGELGWIKTIGSRESPVYASSIAVVQNDFLYLAGYYKDFLSVGDDEYYSSAEHGFIVRIGDFNYSQPPTAINISNDTVPLHTPALTKIGVFTTVDPDSNDQHTYQLIPGDGTNDADNQKFDIIGDTLITAVEFNDDTPDKFSIYVQTKDLGGNTFAREFTINLSVDNETSVNDLSKNCFTLYPNPVNNYLWIRRSEAKPAMDCNLRILSVDGQVVYQKNHHLTRNTRIDLSPYARGIYIVSIQSVNQNLQFKIIKQ
jgi:hypothetical protein